MRKVTHKWDYLTLFCRGIIDLPLPSWSSSFQPGLCRHASKKLPPLVTLCWNNTYVSTGEGFQVSILVLPWNYLEWFSHQLRNLSLWKLCTLNCKTESKRISYNFFLAATVQLLTSVFPNSGSSGHHESSSSLANYRFKAKISIRGN